MDDLISRQAAIDALIELSVQRDEWDSKEGFSQKRGIDAAICAIEDLPSAERRGRWIENEFGAYCSECGLYAYRSNGIPWKSNYCPMCGASMMDDNAIQHTKCVGGSCEECLEGKDHDEE